MQYTASTPQEYISQLPDDRKQAVISLRETIKENLPKDFEETLSYGMIAYVVPKSIYTAGYHANPAEPVPFISIASQKNHIALYHMGIYMFPDVLEWFLSEYPNHSDAKPDMGKSCIRFKNISKIPLPLIAELCRKITMDEYIARYEESIKKKGR